MKIMCISDIHGNIECLNKAIERYREENADKLIILGDFSGYYFSSSDFEVSEILNNMSGAIIAVKGNCDSFETDNLFNFDLGYLKTIDVNGIKVTLTHGHMYNRNNLPENCGEIFLLGHTHVGNVERINGRIIANPGSISKPRGGARKSYLTIDENNIELKALDGEVIKTIKLKK